MVVGVWGGGEFGGTVRVRQMGSLFIDLKGHRVYITLKGGWPMVFWFSSSKMTLGEKKCWNATSR